MSAMRRLRLLGLACARGGAVTNTLQGIYASAASVSGSTGVDPAIIAAMARTEGPTGADAGLISAGIQVAATSGRGSSGSSLGAGSSQIGQPSRFWAYQNGAEMSEAFANYIKHQFPSQAAYLGNASAFFQSMETTNYDVVYNNPAVGPSSGINWTAIKAYWQQKISDAASFVTQWGGGQQGNPTDTQTPNQVDPSTSAGAQLVQGQSDTAQAAGTLTATAGLLNTPWGQITLGGPAGTILARLTSAGFWWAVGFFVLAGLLIAIGVYLTFQKQINQTVVTAGKAAAVAA
jgi:hypothetical protein